MKFMKCFSILCAAVIMFSGAHSVKAGAVEYNGSVTLAENLENDRAAGLIISYSLSMSTAKKVVRITAETFGNGTMAKIGFTDIRIQRSTNGSTNWTDEFVMSDQIVTNAVSHVLNNLPVSVDGGYYYRIKLTHYAKEQGWFFPSSQSITNYSNVGWVPAS